MEVMVEHGQRLAVEPPTDASDIDGKFVSIEGRRIGAAI
jgi:hypothetical protein